MDILGPLSVTTSGNEYIRIYIYYIERPRPTYKIFNAHAIEKSRLGINNRGTIRSLY